MGPSMICPFGVPSALASILYRSELIQPGPPDIGTDLGLLYTGVAARTYASSIANITGMHVMTSLPGCTPRPPRPPPRADGSGEQGLMDTASHFGITGAWGTGAGGAGGCTTANACSKSARCSCAF